MRKPKAKPEPRMEYAPHAETLRQQLEKAIERNLVLEAQIRTLGGKPNPVGVELTRAERVADALALADEVSDPAHSYSFDPTGKHVSDTTALPSPGAGTWFPRKHSKRLKAAIDKALDSFDEAKEHDWHPPAIPRAPKVRCGVRDCPARDHRVDAWRMSEGKTIYHQFCGSCGNPLPAPAKEVA